MSSESKRPPAVFRVKSLFAMTETQADAVRAELEHAWRKACETGMPLVLGDMVEIYEPLTHWEHEVLVVGNLDDLDALLDERQKHGWQVGGMGAVLDVGMVVVLKRPVVPPEEGSDE